MLSLLFFFGAVAAHTHSCKQLSTSVTNISQLQASVDRLLRAEEARASREQSLQRSLDAISCRLGAPHDALEGGGEREAARRGEGTPSHGAHVIPGAEGDESHASPRAVTLSEYLQHQQPMEANGFTRSAAREVWGLLFLVLLMLLGICLFVYM